MATATYRVVMELAYPGAGPEGKPRETIRSEPLSRAAARARLELAYAELKARLATSKLKITKDASRGMGRP